MTDREKYLTILDRFYRGRGGSLLTKDECEAMEYAISSIKTDLKYDLLYEETKHIADTDKMIGSTTKNCRSCRNFGSHHGICEICKDNKCWTGKESTTKNDLGVDREDAVKRLNALKQFIGYDKDSEIVKATQKSLDMAISALEHPKRNVVAIVPCGDAISRQEAIDAIRQLYIDLATQKYVIDLLKILPSVTPHPRKGHWVLRNSFLVPYKCSECNYESERYDNFCPNCGSDNREVENE